MYKIYIIKGYMGFPIEISLEEANFAKGFYFESIEEAQSFINLHADTSNIKYTVLPILSKEIV